MYFYNKHYIRIDGNKVVKGFSDAFEQPLDTDILFNSKGGRHFEIDGEINPPLYDERGCHLYRYEDGLRLATPEEISAEWEKIKPEPPVDKVAELTAMVEAQAEEIQNLHEQLDTAAMQNAKVRQATMFAAFAFTDQQAVQVPTLYPLWSDLPDGTTLTMQEEAVKGTEITRVRGDDGKLYKVIKTHKKQSDWAPGQATASLFIVIDVEHAGTLEDPIPAAVNMEYVKDKYYIEDGQIYRCTRDSGIALQYLPSQLVGQYFDIVEV